MHRPVGHVVDQHCQHAPSAWHPLLRDGPEVGHGVKRGRVDGCGHDEREFKLEAVLGQQRMVHWVYN